MINEGYLDQITAYNFLITKLSRISKEERIKLYKDPNVIKKLGEYLTEAEGRFWNYFRKLVEVISIEEIFMVFSNDILINYLNKNSGQSYIFFCAMLEKDTNKTIEYLLKNEEIFVKFIDTMDYSSSSITELNAMDAFRMIVKMKELNLNKKSYYSFIQNMDEAEQSILIDSIDNTDILAAVIENVSNNKKEDFFMNDKRAILVYKHFNIPSLVKPTLGRPKGIKLHSKILNDKDFFDKIKTTDIIQMRKNINIILQTNPSNKLREDLKKYYDEIISGYDEENKMLEIYKSKYDTYGDLAKIETSNTINELVVDALFEDNLNNVKINIKEILRYNENLDEKIIEQNMVDLYNIILEIENLSNQEKIQLYQKFKDKEINTIFYTHIRKLRNLSYNNIKRSLFSPKEKESLMMASVKNKYGLEVYDLTEQKYTMLVRCINTPFRNHTIHRRDCYTLISDMNNAVFDEESYIYGYEDFDINKVIHVNESDSFSIDDYNDFENITKSINRIMNSEEVINRYSNHTSYSEVQIINESNEGHYQPLKPSYIICYDQISKKVLDESKRLNIPICIIKKKVIERIQSEERENEKYVI